MKLKIEFFNKDLIDAIGSGVYDISIEANGKTKSLYIGESVFVLVRCAAHLYEFKKNPEYFGFDNENINNDSIIFKFSLVEAIYNKSDRKKREGVEISRCEPLSQSGINDRMKDIESKIIALREFLDNSEEN